jgi:hypothetical protein
MARSTGDRVVVYCPFLPRVVKHHPFPVVSVELSARISNLDLRRAYEKPTVALV